MRQFIARPGFRKYFANTSWLLNDNIFSKIKSMLKIMDGVLFGLILVHTIV